MTALELLCGEEAVLPAGFMLGSAGDAVAGSGCTVIICEAGATGGVAVRGGAPASRETELLDPANSVQQVHAVLLSGGSAFGLDAAAGVMEYLSARKVGFELAGQYVPIVCAAALFDLTYGDNSRLPDKAMGYAACDAASPALQVGNVGAGIGATVGKFLAPELAMKSGLGAASLQLGEAQFCAIVAVNALGTVIKPDGSPLAGTRDPQDAERVLPPDELIGLLAATAAAAEGQPVNNTTIACVLTNVAISKPQAHRLASVSHDALARTIVPAHTSMDGDTVFALSHGNASLHPDLCGHLATRCLEAAILSIPYTRL